GSAAAWRSRCCSTRDRSSGTVTAGPHPNMEYLRLEVRGADYLVATGGEGSAVLLLHGFPADALLLAPRRPEPRRAAHRHCPGSTRVRRDLRSGRRPRGPGVYEA